MTASASPLPQPAPATSADLGHPIRYPLHIERDNGEVEWRAACNCHYWRLLDTAEAKRAIQ